MFHNTAVFALFLIKCSLGEQKRLLKHKKAYLINYKSIQNELL